MSAPRYPAPRILDELPSDRPAVIEASAGTGKTYTLEHLVVDRLLRDPDLTIEQVLVVTFTEKATHEVRARIRGLLESLARLTEDMDGVDAHDGPVWTIDDGARATLRRALRDYDRASIQTIHAFCQRVLTEHAFGVGRLFDPVLVDGEATFRAVFREQVRRRLATEAPWSTLFEAWLANGGSIDRLSTFAFKALELRTPIANALEPAVWHETVTAFAAWLDDEATAVAAEIVASKPNATFAKLAERIVLWRAAPSVGAALALACGGGNATGIHKTAWGALAKLGTPAGDRAHALLDRVIALREAFDATVVGAAVPLVRAAFVEHKRARGEVDYADMLDAVADALDGPAGDELVGLLRRRYRVALIDEFQDTDDVQWRIFRRLFDPASGAALYTVGDPKQAIYGFRGADVHTYLRARDAIEASGARVALRDNYRSTPRLIEALNVVLDAEQVQPYFDGAIRYDEPVRAGRSTPSGDEDGPPIRLLRCDPRERPAAIAAEADRLRREGFVDDLSKVFVLVPTWREATDVREACREAGVRAGVVRTEPRSGDGGMRDVRDVLVAVDDPFDTRRRLRAWATPLFAARLPDLADWRDVDVDHPAFARLLEWRGLAERRRFAELFAQLVDGSGYRRRAIFEASDDRAFGEALVAIDLLQDVVTRGPATLRELIDRLGRWIDKTEAPIGQIGVQRVENARDAVQIMTMHASKGLEADVVFLHASGGGWRGSSTDLDTYYDGGARRAYVGSRTKASKDVKEAIKRFEFEENQRLGYVAITRAARRLYVGLEEKPADGSRLEPLIGRLNRLISGGVVDARPDLFAVIDAPPPRVAPPIAGSADLADWQPPSPPPSGTLAVDFDACATAARPIVVTSYSRMKRDTTAWGDAITRDTDAPSAAAVARGELVGGAESGSLVHEAIERVDLAAVRALAFDAWCDDPAVNALFDEVMRRYGRDSAQRPSAMRLVHTALRAPLALGDATIDGVAAIDHVVREAPFLYPIASTSDPLGTVPPDDGFVVEDGYLRGVIDVLFEHDGRAFLVDWKADVLADYGPDAIAAHVERHYRRQREIYLAALVRMLGVADADGYDARVGGFAFVFVRGLDHDGGRGVDFARPSWDALCTSDAGLRDDVVQEEGR